jgi:hypothetical protein
MSRTSSTERMNRRSFLKRAAVGATVPTVGGGGVKAEVAASQAGQPLRTARVFAYGYDQEPYRLDPGTHLFVDWRYVQAGRVSWKTADGKEAPLFAHREIQDLRGTPRGVPFGIRLVAQKADKIGPIIANDRDWEFMIPGHCSLHPIERGFGLWYEVVPPGGDGSANLLCYAESGDGVNWQKPELGLVDFAGSRKNNIVIDAGRCPYKSFHGDSVFIDPSAPADQRFKLIYMAMLRDDAPIARIKKARPWSVSALGERKRRAILCGTSPDGLHWTCPNDILMIHQSDTQSTVYYDEVLKRYVGYYRTLLMDRRGIGRAETEDMRRWPVPETVLWPHPDDDPSDDYYRNSKSIYPGTRTMHVMFPTVYKRRVDACTMRMAASLDGALWEWLPGGNVLECGPVGSWDAGCLFGGFGLTQISNDRVALPYAGFQHPHKYPRWGRVGAVGLAVWKKERLAALRADEEGEFWTPLLVLPGEALYLNYETRRAGYVKVEVDGVGGRRLDDCDPLTGDRLKAQVSWGGETTLRVPRNAAAVLRFRMRAASLYSIEVR